MKAHEIVIIGGGVIGTSCAYYLSKRGFDVAIIEVGDFASGTSSHCDACAMLTDKKPGPDAALGYASILRFKKLAEDLDLEFGFRQDGSMYVCESEKELEVAADYVKSMANEGYPVRMISKAEMAERESFLARDLAGGFWSDACSSMNPLKLCYSFAYDASKKYGMTQYIYTRVTGIRLSDDGSIAGVETNKGFVPAKFVVNCAGIWAKEIGDMLGLNIPVKPRKGVILLTEQAYPFVHQKVQEFGYMLTKFEDVRFTRTVDEDVEKYNVAFTIEPTDANNVMLGSSRNLVGYSLHSEMEVVSAIARRGIRFYPILKELNCIRAYAGLRPFVEDHMPIISPVKKIPGYYIATGHEGDGIAMAPVTGLIISQLISGETPELDISAFTYERFENQ